MKKYLYIMLSVVLAGIFGACSKDDPFGAGNEKATGRLLTAALDLSLQNENGPRQLHGRGTRAAAPSVDSFTVSFYKDGSDEPEVSYLYSQMPEIITLPVGSYRAVASYGLNPDAAWESPYYEGETSFLIEANVITDSVEAIVCRFANIRVSVDFSAELKQAMGSDCKVTVNVGDRGSLDFTVNDTERSGYFRYIEGSSTLAAEFTGTVDGVATRDVKTRADIVAGTHYAIMFTLRDAGADDPGAIVPGPGSDGIVSVDATITVDDMNNETVDPGEEPMEDDWRPQEGQEPGKDDPDPDEPGDVTGNPPVITASPGITLDGRNYMQDGMTVELTVTSEIGFEEFTVEIDSSILGPAVEELLGTTTFDLIDTPESYREFLENQGFPTNVKGKKKAEISLSEFIPMILLLAGGESGDYSFIFTVRDANGTTHKTLTLYN